MPRILFTFLALLALSAPALAGDMQPVLRLDLMVDARPEHTVILLASEADPNVAAADDRYGLTVDGRAVTVPQTLLARLSHARRGYSYDHFTGGLDKDEARATCMMAGPGRGAVLSVLYLAYDGSRIADAQMRPVLSRADNCLFTLRLRPVDDEARAEAAAALAALRTILEIERG